MKKHILAFAIALGVLIISISLWVVYKNIAGIRNPEPTIEIETEGGSVVRGVDYEEHMQRGKRASKLGDYEMAVAEFAAAAKLDPSSINPLLELAEAQIQLKQFDKAENNLTLAEKLDAVHPAILVLKGIIFIRESKFAKAEEVFAKAGDDGVFWEGLVASFFDKDNRAKGLLTESDDSRAQVILDAYTELANYPDATKTHHDALLARAYNQIGEYELAIAKIKPILASDADYRDAWLLLGYAQYALGNYESARQSWATAYLLDTTKAETQYFLGLANFKLEDYDAAVKFLLLAKENGYHTEDLGDKLAESYLKEGDFREAAAVMVESITKNPQAALNDFLTPISLYLTQLQDGRSAWNLASEAVERYPGASFAYNLAGWVSLENGYLEESYTQLRKAVDLDPSAPWPHFNLAKYYEKKGEIENALSEYKSTFELDKNGEAGKLAADAYNRLLQQSK